MSEMITCYIYDEAGYFAGEHVAQEDPRGNGYLMPLNATLETPPVRNGFFTKWGGSAWTLEEEPKSADDLLGIEIAHKTDTPHKLRMMELMTQFVDNSDGKFSRSLDKSNRFWTVTKKPDPTPEELEAQELEALKTERAAAVSRIVVEVDGMKFDGDEESQGRLSRTISAAVALGVDLDSYTQVWVLADNTVAQPTIRQLAEALKLAGEAQTALWTVPYEEAKA